MNNKLTDAMIDALVERNETAEHLVMIARIRLEDEEAERFAAMVSGWVN